MPHKDRNEHLEYHKKYYAEHREKVIEQVCENQKRNRPQRREYEKERYDKIKLEAINHYGGKCACCGETQIAFLQIDHINNDGAEHRREIEKASHGRVPMTLWLKRNNYPDGFQVLCANCNVAKQIAGTCPHKLAEAAEMAARLEKG